MQNAQTMTGHQLYARLAGYVAPYWGMLAVALPGMLVLAVTEPALPLLLKLMLDGTLVNPKHELVQLVPLVIIAFFVARGVASHLSIYALGWVSGRLVVDLRVSTFDRLLTLPARYYADHASDSLVATITADTNRTVATAAAAVTVLTRDTLAIIALLAWMFYLDWKPALLAVSLIPAIMLIVRLSNGQLQTGDRETSSTPDGMAQVVQESVRNHKVIKLDGGQQYQSQRLRNEVERVHRATMKQATAKAFSTALVHMAVGVVLALAIYPAAQQAATDGAAAGSFVSLSVAMMLLILPVRRVALAYMLRQQGLAAAASVFALLEQKAESDGGTIDIGRARGELRFEQVSFRCQSPADAALEEITLTLQPGETLALTDSALADLAPRFSQPDSGKILLDGHDLTTLTLTSLRANIALISRETMLFSDTVAANIAYGAKGHATEAEIIAAMHAAHAAEFIRELPQGLQTVVGEQGVQLADDQRLRIAIARALLKNPPILILDEAVSELDAESGQQVQAALATLMQGRTSIISAPSGAKRTNRSSLKGLQPHPNLVVP